MFGCQMFSGKISFFMPKSKFSKLQELSVVIANIFPFNKDYTLCLYIYQSYTFPSSKTKITKLNKESAESSISPYMGIFELENIIISKLTVISVLIYT